MTPRDNPNDLIKKILLKGSQLGARLFRRNTGRAWTGNKITTHADGSITIHDPRPFHAGIKGQADVYGWDTVTVTQEMVGDRIAVHVEIEAKTGTGRLTAEQVSWLETVRHAGGKAGVARSEGDVGEILVGFMCEPDFLVKKSDIP